MPSTAMTLIYSLCKLSKLPSAKKLDFFFFGSTDINNTGNILLFCHLLMQMRWDVQITFASVYPLSQLVPIPLHLGSYQAFSVECYWEEGLLKVLSWACGEVVMGPQDRWWRESVICSQDLISEPQTGMPEAKICFCWRAGVLEVL